LLIRFIFYYYKKHSANRNVAMVQLFHQTQKSIQIIGKKGKTLSAENKTISTNVVSSLARELQDLSLVFRKAQSTYLNSAFCCRGWVCTRAWPLIFVGAAELKGQEDRVQGYSKGKSGAAGTTAALPNGEGDDDDDGGFFDKVCC
jgi:hypothetical protein